MHSSSIFTPFTSTDSRDAYGPRTKTPPKNNIKSPDDSDDMAEVTSGFTRHSRVPTSCVLVLHDVLMRSPRTRSESRRLELRVDHWHTPIVDPLALAIPMAGNFDMTPDLRASNYSRITRPEVLQLHIVVAAFVCGINRKKTLAKHLT
ncbi:uncharacterized protein N7482_007315 [Penicillium canariense]|uniref:Uncharacterized protein n=1 Tax=Penicillium canariense TaxID=189055 RepID=A0A9W9HZ77_9EURO|nr:uncharacterized protein N7482_007315 [Penicillium canariense]KAJ5160311.1 hypothetical protein N7482_007315 [Penicillium canariense]